MARILLTGANGFIGQNLIDPLGEAGHSIVSLTREQGDIASPELWQSLPAADVVIHLAARSFVPDSWKEPQAFIQANVMGMVQALEFCRRSGARLVYLSSYLYGFPESLPIAETAPINPTNPYALTKSLAEEIGAFYAAHFETTVTMLRPFNVYGVGQRQPFLVPWIFAQIREGREIRVKDLEPRRDYVYLPDVVSAILSALEQRSGHTVFNIGSGESHSVSELIDIIQRAMGTSLPVISAEERREGEVMDVVADISRAREQFGWAPRYSLRDGIADLVARENVERPR